MQAFILLPSAIVQSNWMAMHEMAVFSTTSLANYQVSGNDELLSTLCLMQE
jgi:hypothetical protein